MPPDLPAHVKHAMKKCLDETWEAAMQCKRYARTCVGAATSALAARDAAESQRHAARSSFLLAGALCRDYDVVSDPELQWLRFTVSESSNSEPAANNAQAQNDGSDDGDAEESEEEAAEESAEDYWLRKLANQLAMHRKRTPQNDVPVRTGPEPKRRKIAVAPSLATSSWKT